MSNFFYLAQHEMELFLSLIFLETNSISLLAK